MTQLQHFTEIERTLWTNDAKVYEATFLPNAVLIFPYIGRVDQGFAVKAIREENASGRHWTDYEARAIWNDGTEERSHCATLYVRHDDRWYVAFHQQTRAELMG